MSNVPLEIIVTGNTDGANSALRKTQEELGRTAIAAQKTDSSLQKLGQDSGKSIFNLTEKLRGLESAVFTEKSVAKIASFNKEIEVTKGEINKLSNAGKTGFNNFGEAVGKSNNALSKSFGALRQIAYIVPGIGLAGIFNLAFEAIIKVISATQTLTRDQQILSDVFKSAAKSAGEQVATLTLYQQKIGNLNLSQSERIKFAKEYNEVADKANKIDLTQINNLDLINSRINAQIKLIEARALATAAEAKLGEQAAKVIEAQLDVSQFEKFKDARKLTSEELKKANQIDIAEQSNNNKLNQSLNSDNLSQRSRYFKAVSTQNQQALDGAIKFNAAKLKLDKEQAELERQARLLNPLLNDTLASKEVKPIKVKEVKIKPQKVTIDIGDATTGLEDAGADLADRLVRGVESEIEQRGSRSSITERAGADFADAYISGAVAEFDSSGKDALKDSVDGFNKLLVQSIADIQIDALVGLGEAIGDALSGGQNVIPNLFGAIFNSVGTQIQNLGKYLIKAAIEVKAAKEAFAKIIGNFPLAIVAGVGLIALGAILKKQAQNQFPGFATGVRNFRGGTAIVGERGPELVNLPQGSDVIPNRALQGTSAGGGNVFIAESVIRGTDLVTIFNRATAQNRRNG